MIKSAASEHQLNDSIMLVLIDIVDEEILDYTEELDKSTYIEVVVELYAIMMSILVKRLIRAAQI
jgi:hypothetical protein